MLKVLLKKLLAKEVLTQVEAEEAMHAILEGADAEQIASFLSILKFRGETVDEIVGMARALLKRAVAISLPYPVLDIVGTGGDLAGTVNISTGSAILAAACGIPVAKHGNRSASGRCGSADVLEAMGLEIEIPPEKCEEFLQKMNFTFLFAPFYHPALKKIAPLRKKLSFPTVFNLLGPLVNPVEAEYALIGVSKLEHLTLFSEAVLQLGNKKRALIFHGCGLDELTPLGMISAYEIFEGKKTKIEIDPRLLGFSPCTLQDLQGGDASCNAELLLNTFEGKKGAIFDSLVFNAAAALFIFGKASSLQEGVLIAKDVLESGKALHVLKIWKEFSLQAKGEPCSAGF